MMDRHPEYDDATPSVVEHAAAQCNVHGPVSHLLPSHIRAGRGSRTSASLAASQPQFHAHSVKVKRASPITPRTTGSEPAVLHEWLGEPVSDYPHFDPPGVSGQSSPKSMATGAVLR